MRLVRFHFDLVALETEAWFDRLPEVMAGTHAVIEHCPVAPPSGHAAEPWVALLVACGRPGQPPGRWVCEQVIRRWRVEPIAEVAMQLQPHVHGAAAMPTAPSAASLPAIESDGRWFAGQGALARWAAAWVTPAA